MVDRLMSSEDDPEAVPVVLLYGSEDRPSFFRDAGPCFAIVRVPIEGKFRVESNYGEITFYSRLGGCASAHSVLSHASRSASWLCDFSLMSRFFDGTMTRVIRPRGGRKESAP